MRLRRPGEYQLQAAITALQIEAPSAEATDWAQIAELYGGQVQPWTPAGGTQQWEVVSDTKIALVTPAQAARIGTPASISASEPEQTVAIEEEPFDSRTSETTRMVYGNSS